MMVRSVFAHLQTLVAVPQHVAINKSRNRRLGRTEFKRYPRVEIASLNLDLRP